MQVIAIFGPTGVGKTAVAVALARLLRAQGEDPVAVSADALQVYEGLETLTGVATAEERGELEHRLISFVPVTETFSAGRYATLAHAEIDSLLAARRRPIVLGGTGLYLRAALTALSLRPPPAPGQRERILQRLDALGPQALHAELAQLAPSTAARIEPSDRQRIVRALELASGGELHEHAGENELWTAHTRAPTLLAGLTMDRDALYSRIDARVERMVQLGVREEVLLAAQRGASVTARKALGFQELLDGDVEAMKRRTRNYARRQLTWMRKLAGVRPIDVSGRDPADVASEIVELTLRLLPA
jgi:tRNA dimethylallyltransferase